MPLPVGLRHKPSCGSGTSLCLTWHFRGDQAHADVQDRGCGQRLRKHFRKPVPPAACGFPKVQALQAASTALRARALGPLPPTPSSMPAGPTDRLVGACLLRVRGSVVTHTSSPCLLRNSEPRTVFSPDAHQVGAGMHPPRCTWGHT